MTTAIIGTGRIGSVIARQLAAGGETLRLSSADPELHQRWRHRSVRLRSSPPATGTRCRVLVLSSSRCVLPC